MRMQKAIFLLPGPYVYEDRCQAYIAKSTLFNYREPLEEMFSASILENQGVQCKIIHHIPQGFSKKKLLSEISVFMPDKLFISTTYPGQFNDLSFLPSLREILPNCQFIARGGHFRFINREEVLKLNKDLDIIIRGDLAPLLLVYYQYFLKDLSKIPNITYRKNNQEIIDNPSKELSKSAWMKFFPSRELVDSTLYRYPLNGRPMGTILVNSGCKGSCSFCLAPILSNNNIYHRDHDIIIREIKRCLTKYKISNFLFKADSINWDYNWIYELCKKIIDEKIKINWCTSCLLDRLDFELLSVMKNSGLQLLTMGIESGDGRTLQKINKIIEVKKLEQVLKWCKQLKIVTVIYFVMGFPDENFEQIENTLKLIDRVDSNFVEIFFYYPLPGTTFFSEHQNRFSPYSQQIPLFYPKDISHKTLLKIKKQKKLKKILHVKNLKLINRSNLAYTAIQFFHKIILS